MSDLVKLSFLKSQSAFHLSWGRYPDALLFHVPLLPRGKEAQTGSFPLTQVRSFAIQIRASKYAQEAFTRWWLGWFL